MDLKNANIPIYRAYKKHGRPLGYIHLTDCYKKPINQYILFSAYALVFLVQYMPSTLRSRNEAKV